MSVSAATRSCASPLASGWRHERDRERARDDPARAPGALRRRHDDLCEQQAEEGTSAVKYRTRCTGAQLTTT